MENGVFIPDSLQEFFKQRYLFFRHRYTNIIIELFSPLFRGVDAKQTGCVIDILFTNIHFFRIIVVYFHSTYVFLIDYVFYHTPSRSGGTLPSQEGTFLFCHRQRSSYGWMRSRRGVFFSYSMIQSSIAVNTPAKFFFTSKSSNRKKLTPSDSNCFCL